MFYHEGKGTLAEVLKVHCLSRLRLVACQCQSRDVMGWVGTLENSIRLARAR